MLFFKSKIFHHRPGAPPKVLALYSDPSIGDIRLRPYLDALQARGIIADYVAVDRNMNPMGPPRSFDFTHIWCQRNVSTAQFRFLNRHASNPIVYDLDDLLSSPPRYVMKTRQRTLTRMTRCIELAKAVTTPSEELARSLRQDIAAFSGDALILKNGCADGEFAIPSRPKQQIIWTSGYIPLFSRESPYFVENLAALANKMDHEVILIGTFEQGIDALFDKVRLVPHLDFRSYREFLRFHAGALAIAPLPTTLPPDQQRYFDAKSDIKLVDYLGSGIIPIYSSAVPFVNSDLAVPTLAAASGDDIIAILRHCIDNYASVADDVRAHLRNGALRARSYWELSKTLDHLFL
ncbi:MAG: hypothetical protein E7813_08015 [Bradyrhizobium sp.]|uniref:hypothetical protein n=1 Tax=Bradyrhizobium sp. TaxID=376 RepID=UPI00121E7ADD|nr:hypothetical protein [Bradyrhizobium sp.]THD70539.1 MAG: hypothetical protein E7813_08015 [Bradyrhizobium sp.]